MRKLPFHLLLVIIFLARSAFSNSELQDISFLRQARKTLKSKPLSYQCLGKLEEAYHIYMRRQEVLIPIERTLKKRKYLELQMNRKIQGLIDQGVGKGKVLKDFAIFSSQREQTLTDLYKKVEDIYEEAQSSDSEKSWEEANNKVKALEVSKKESELYELRKAIGFDSLLAGHKIEEAMDGNQLVITTEGKEYRYYTYLDVGKDNAITARTVIKPNSFKTIQDWSATELQKTGFKSTFTSRLDQNQKPLVSVKTDYILSLVTAYAFLGIRDAPQNVLHFEKVSNILKDSKSFSKFYFDMNNSLEGIDIFGPKDCAEYIKNNNTRVSGHSVIKSYEIQHDFNKESHSQNK
tara:strand:- start:26 stop:1072 length:1047 start_codon:yes stop_codon:yes gene_type:complete